MAIDDLKDTNRITSPEKWNPFLRIDSHMYIMTCYCLESVQYAPLYIHSFRLRQPSRPLEAERFQMKYTDPAKIATVKDKLRYYRHKKARRQKDVVEKTRIHSAAYCVYEQEDRRTPYPLDKLGKVAELIGVPITDLLKSL